MGSVGGFCYFCFEWASHCPSAGDLLQYYSKGPALGPRKNSSISRTFLLKFWAKNRGCHLYTRPLLSEGVKWLVGVAN